MVQINETSTIQDNGKGQRAFRGFLRFFWTIVFLGQAWLELSKGNKTFAAIFFVCAVLYFLFINSIVWNIANTVRKWVMPEAFITANATESFRKKIFWSIGPQWFGSMFFWGIITWSAEAYNDLKPAVKADRSASTGAPAQTTGSSGDKTPTYTAPQAESSTSTSGPDSRNAAPADQRSQNKQNEQPFTKEQVEELERNANYSGDDPVIRERLGLPPKVRE